MFSTVLVANRGEIAVRVVRTLRRLGIRSVAVYSDADAGARHVREADVAVRLGPAPARDSYLSAERILAAAAQTGAQAVHPGYGFLAEAGWFARACAQAGLVFIGPPPAAVEVMGDKIRAKQTVVAAGVPVVPGRADRDMSDDDLVEAAAQVGYPVLVKPSAGGGGKGMHLVHEPGDLRAALRTARREAAGSFGDDTLFLERFVLRPRHIEVQVLADAHGTTVHLGERECSLQRRHQKVIEEAPSPLLDEATRARIGAAAVATAAAVGYQGAGTVEFIVSSDDPDAFYFMEMNTRLQVEHPVTELVTGLDLVEQQLRVASGAPLAFAQDDVRLVGHAVEARVYAEDPARGFLPTGGAALVVREPQGEGVRVDSSLLQGTAVGTTYDPMLSKIVAWGPDRATALARLDRALAGTVLLGCGTNIGFLRALLASPEVQAGRLDTGLLERSLDQLVERELPPIALAGFAMRRLLDLQPPGPVGDPWAALTGWRVGEPAPVRWDVLGLHGERLHLVAGRGRLVVGEATCDVSAVPSGNGGLLLSLDGATYEVLTATDGPSVWVAADGGTWQITEAAPARVRTTDAQTDAEVRSPMPGAVVGVYVGAGQLVAPGDPLLAVEAMKMEHVLKAPLGGAVEVLVREGEQVVVGQPVARVHPEVEAA